MIDVKKGITGSPLGAPRSAMRPVRKTPRHLVALLAGGVLALARAAAAQSPSSSDLGQLSIEDLAAIDVSSVSKTPEPLSDAPAAIYVITHDDIVRSGATSLPEMLRLAPNLQV